MIHNFLYLLRIVFICIFCTFSCCYEIQAKISKQNYKKHKITKQTTYYPRIKTSLVIDTDTGRILHSENAQSKIYPASLTKVMTLYIIFDAIKSRAVSVNKYFYVSDKASKAVPCKLGLETGARIKVSDVILGLIVKSANDTAIVAAENIAGSEERFTRLMNKKAKQLNMHNTLFKNASGLHHPEQQSTASDLAKLALSLKHNHPDFYHLFAKTSFQFNGKTICSHNHLTKHYKGATGLKTGFTNHAGFNLITTAKRGDHSLLGVVTGCDSAVLRNKKMKSLLDKHFACKKSSKSRKKV